MFSKSPEHSNFLYFLYFLYLIPTETHLTGKHTEHARVAYNDTLQFAPPFPLFNLPKEKEPYHL